MNTEQLSKLFTYCDRKYFGGSLPEPRLRVSHSRTALGSFSCKRKRKGLPSAFLTVKGGTAYDFRIAISDYYVMTADQTEDVMIHEMIHYYIAFAGIRDSAPHGIVFRRMMEELNQKFGRHISVMTSTKGWQPREKPKQQVYLVLGLETDDGKYYLTSVNPKSASKLEYRIRTIKSIVFHKWVQTNDEFFSAFPRVRSLRGRRVEKSLFESKLGIDESNGK